MSTTPPSNDAVNISIIVPVHKIASHLEESPHLRLELSRDVFTVIEDYRNKSGIRLTTLILICMPINIAMSQKKFEHETEFARLLIILLCLNYVIGNLADDHFETKSNTMFISMIFALLLTRISPDIGRQASESNS